MPFQLSPGVNITELDLTTIVPSVATTKTGIAGQFQWGPVDQIVLVDSENNLVKYFGLPDTNTYQYFFTAANFLGYGNNLQVVRVVGSGALNAGSAAGLLVKNDEVDLTGLTSSGPFLAKYPGTLGNSLSISVCGSATGTTLSVAGSTYGSWAYKSNFNDIPSTSLFDSSLGGANDEFHLVVVDQRGAWTGVTGTVLERFTVSTDPDAQASDGTSLFYKNKINRESSYIWCVGPVVGNAANAANTGLSASASFPGGTAVGNFSFSASNAANNSAGVFNYTLTAGAIGTTVTDGNLITSTNNSGQGYDLFSDPETVEVALLLGGPIGTTAAANLVSLAETRKDCVAFVSPNTVNNSNVSEATKLASAIAFRNSLQSSSYGFLDSGYKLMYDRYNDVNRWVPLNGDVAGLCVRTDYSNDPWWSFAGYNRGQIRGAVKLAFNPNKTSRDELYKKGINPVVSFPGEGTILYGDKTLLAKPSSFDRINVRRLFIVLEKAIATAAKFSLFEFNDDFTRSQFKSIIEPFLRDVQSRRGITEFKVVCDSSNNTPSVIDSNSFVADIYVKANRSINFIQLNFINTRSGVSFEEVGA